MPGPIVEVIWNLRTPGWFARWPGSEEWRRVPGHLPPGAPDLALVGAVRGAAMTADAQGLQVRKLEPAHRLPKADR